MIVKINEKIFIAGSTGMVGQAITRNLIKKGYGNKENGGSLLTPSRQELNLTNNDDVENWFEINKLLYHRLLPC